jgi:F-type H+-transporting ATPase subunit b
MFKPDYTNSRVCDGGSSMNSSVPGRKRFPAWPFPLLLLFVVSAAPALGAEGGGGLTVIPDWTFLLQMANFLLLIWVLNLILYRPIRNVLIQRKQKVSGLEESIQAAQKDVSDKEEAYLAGLRDARVKGLKKKEALLNEAAEEEKRIISAINEKAQAQIAEVKVQVAKEAEAVSASLMKDVGGFAKAIGQKILGRAI